MHSTTKGPNTSRLAAAVMLGLCVGIGAIAYSASATAQTTEVKRYSLPVGTLDESLAQFGRQSGLQMLVPPELVAGHRVGAISGEFTHAEMLDRLLQDTGLAWEQIPSGAIVIKKKVPAPAVRPSSEVNRTTGVEKEDEITTLQDVLVTGSYIHGAAPIGSPLKIYARDDIDRSGVATTDQFARLMTENFANTDQSFREGGATYYAPLRPGQVTNAYSGAAFNLRGIGPSSTLTLLNGRRLPAAGSGGSFVDISMIPLTVIDRIEVLTDGASAVYGADAVAGVVNMITRKDFTGAETSARYTAATEGGAIQRTVSQLLGKSWSTGNVFASVEHDEQDGLDASDRRYIAAREGATSLLPESRRNSTFVSANQAVGSNTNLLADASFSKRRFSSDSYTDSPFFTQSRSQSGFVEQMGGGFGVERSLPSDWRLNINSDYSKIKQSSADDYRTVLPMAMHIFSTSGDEADTLGIDVIANGPLFLISEGRVKGAFGATFREDGYSGVAQTSINGNLAATVGTPKASRRVKSLFADILLPVIGKENSIGRTSELNVSLAGRYDHYSDFGSTSNYKAGLVWSPISGISIRGSYGTSFRAPLLSQLHEIPAYSATPIVDPNSPSGVTNALTLNGSNLALGPEESRSYTLGLDIRPTSIPGLNLDITYYRINYEDRVSTPPSALGGGLNLEDPLLMLFVTRNPPLNLVQEHINTPYMVYIAPGITPENIGAILDLRYTNIAVTRQSGIDININHGMETAYGAIQLAISATRLLKNEYQPINQAPGVDLLNTLAQPPKWKGRGSIAWNEGAFSISLSINYVNSYSNPLFNPATSIGSWLTTDLNFGYSIPGSDSSISSGWQISFNVNNLANERPPFVQIPASAYLPGSSPPFPFDSANASAIGRLVSVQVRKGW